MPRPESATRSVSHRVCCSSVPEILTLIFPPSGVNLKAFPSRLKRIRSTFSSSSQNSSDVLAQPSVSIVSCMFCEAAMGSKLRVHSFTFFTTGTRLRCMGIRPDSMRRMSRICPTSLSMTATFRCAVCSSCLVSEFSGAVFSNCSMGLAMRVSGVRKSWDTLVKKFSFDCVASSTCLDMRTSSSRCCSRSLF